MSILVVFMGFKQSCKCCSLGTFPKTIDKISGFWKYHLYNLWVFIYLKWWSERPRSTLFRVNATFSFYSNYRNSWNHQNPLISIRLSRIFITRWKGKMVPVLNEVDCDVSDHHCRNSDLTNFLPTSNHFPNKILLVKNPPLPQKGWGAGVQKK